jgi:hypothetical protein
MFQLDINKNICCEQLVTINSIMQKVTKTLSYLTYMNLFVQGKGTSTRNGWYSTES